MKKVLCSYESVGPSIRAKHKIGHYDLYFYSKSLPYIQEHVMYEHYASEYESVGPV